MPAECLGIAHRTGSVTQGKTADLVLLRANPLDDIKNTARTECVILKGKLFDRKALDGMLARGRNRAKSTRRLMKSVPWLAE